MLVLFPSGDAASEEKHGSWKEKSGKEYSVPGLHPRLCHFLWNRSTTAPRLSQQPTISDCDNARQAAVAQVCEWTWTHTGSTDSGLPGRSAGPCMPVHAPQWLCSCQEWHASNDDLQSHPIRQVWGVHTWCQHIIPTTQIPTPIPQPQFHSTKPRIPTSTAALSTAAATTCWELGMAIISAGWWGVQRPGRATATGCDRWRDVAVVSAGPAATTGSEGRGVVVMWAALWMGGGWSVAAKEPERTGSGCKQVLQWRAGEARIRVLRIQEEGTAGQDWVSRKCEQRDNVDWSAQW